MAQDFSPFMEQISYFFAGFSNEAMANEEWITVYSLEEAKEKIEAFETATTTRYCSIRNDKGFGRTGR